MGIQTTAEIGLEEGEIAGALHLVWPMFCAGEELVQRRFKISIFWSTEIIGDLVIFEPHKAHSKRMRVIGITDAIPFLKHPVFD